MGMGMGSWRSMGWLFGAVGRREWRREERGAKLDPLLVSEDVNDGRVGGGGLGNIDSAECNESRCVLSLVVRGPRMGLMPVDCLEMPPELGCLGQNVASLGRAEERAPGPVR